MFLRNAMTAAVSGLCLVACATPTGPEAKSLFDSFEMTETVDLSSYDRVFIPVVDAGDEVMARIGYRPIGPTDRIRPLSARDIERRGEALRDDLVREVGAVATIVEAPAPGVLTISATITDLDANRPTQAELAATPSLDFDSISVGGAAVRVTFSEDGRQLAVAEDAERLTNINDPAVGVGIWTVSDRFFNRFARQMAALLS